MIITSCHWPLRHYQKSYQQAATSIPPLKMPPEVKMNAVKSAYPLPSHGTSANFTKQPSLVPPGNPGAA